MSDTRDDRSLERVGDGGSPAVPPAEAGQVPDGGDPSGEALVVLRPGLERERERVVGRPDLVRAQRGQHLAAPEQDPQVRAEDLVRRARDEIGADRTHVDPSVLCEMDPVARDDGRRPLVDQPGELVV